MESEKRLKEIAKAAGYLCNNMMDMIRMTDDTKIRLVATEVIYTAGYIQGLCGQQFDDDTEEER